MALSPSTVQQQAAASTVRPGRALLLQRAMGVLGVCFLGSYTVGHLLGLLPMVTGGADAFNATLSLRKSWLLLGANVFWVGIPLVVHALHGVWRLAALHSNAARFPTRTNWVFTLRRWAGPVILLFIVVHVWALRVSPWLSGQAVDAGYVSRHLAPFLTLDLYVLGVGALAFHFSAGLWHVLIRWGVTVSAASQRRAAWWCAGLGMLLAAWGVLTAAAFHDGKFVIP